MLVNKAFLSASPPPVALLTILDQNCSYVTFNGNTEEKMYHAFKQSPNGNKVNHLFPLTVFSILCHVEEQQETDGV